MDSGFSVVKFHLRLPPSEISEIISLLKFQETSGNFTEFQPTFRQFHDAISLVGSSMMHHTENVGSSIISLLNSEIS